MCARVFVYFCAHGVALITPNGVICSLHIRKEPSKGGYRMKRFTIFLLKEHVRDLLKEQRGASNFCGGMEQRAPKTRVATVQRE